MPATSVTGLARKARARSAPPGPTDPVTSYALDVLEGRIVAGRLVRLACERHVRDLADGAARGLTFDVAAAGRAIAFFGLLRHYKGEWGPLPGVRTQGLPITLEGWQRFVIGSLFGWKRADGTRRFRYLYLEVAKKNGKTLLAAGIGILLAFFDGEPGAEVYSYATKRDQAKFVWNDAEMMVAKNAGLARRISRYALTLSDEASASFFKPLGEDAGTSDQGVNAHGVIVDELHVIGDRDGIDNLETATTARRQPVVVKITTAGVKRESVWAEERRDAVSVVTGRATDDSLLVLVYSLDTIADGAEVDDDPFDEALWPKANPNLAVSVKVDGLREAAATARRSPGKLSAFLRFRMNVATGVSTRAIDIDEWDENAGLIDAVDEEGLPLGRPETYDEWAARVLVPARPCYGGLDLASVRDITALILLFRDAELGTYDVLCRFWVPAESVADRVRVDGVPYDAWIRDGFLQTTPGNVTDYAFIRAEILALAETYQLGEIGYDVWNATQLALELQQDGASVVAVHQTHAGLAPAWREVTKDILDRKLRHGGHPVLRWMAGNVETELDPAGNEKPSKRHSTERVDGIIGLTMARGRWVANPEVVTWTAA